MIGFDVAVIGAGIHGVSVAYHLTSRARTVIFDRDTPASGPTGRSTAIVRAYYSNEFLARAALESIEMFGNFQDITGRDAGFHRSGMVVLHAPTEVDQVRKMVPKLCGLGVDTELLEVSELAQRWPLFDIRGIGIAAFERGAGHADPTATTFGLFVRGLEFGLATRLGTAVRTIDPDGNGWLLGTDAGERVRCERVVIAAGPWTRSLARQVGADLPLTVEREPVLTLAWGKLEPVVPHIDLVGGYSLRGEGTELYLVDPLISEPGADPDANSEDIRVDETARLVDAVVRRLPHLVDSEVRGGWASLYDVSPDWQPVIGEIAPGVFVDAGTSGHGFKLAPALGHYIADLVMGDATPPELEQFHPRRFLTGNLLDSGYGDVRVLG